MLHQEWLRQGPAFPLMKHLCRYFSYTHTLAEVHYYEFATDAVSVIYTYPETAPTISVHLHHHANAPEGTWYQMPSCHANNHFLKVVHEGQMVGLYMVKANVDSMKIPTEPWTLGGLHNAYISTWLHDYEWKFANQSSERWIVVNKNGVQWYNQSIAPWFRADDYLGYWPAWVHEDAVVRNAIFWEQMATKDSWTGMVSGNQEHPSTWWFVQKLRDDAFLVRVNTYEELTTNLLAQSHWQRHDPLTALPREVQMQWHWAGNDETPWSLALISMDHFYALSDQYGTENVDKGLLAVANKLKDILPATWSVWRGRVDQFYAMGPNIQNEWFLNALRIPVEDCVFDEVSTSIGIGADPTFSHAKKLAQEANALCIEKGGRQIMFNSYPKRLRSAASLQESMAQIRMDKDVALVYDPIYKSSIVGYRLHTNWNHPTWGVIKGNDFLPQCEPDIRKDYILWTLQQLSAKSLEWKTLGLNTEPLALWPLPSKIWTDPHVQAVLSRPWKPSGLTIQRVLEIDEADALSNFDVLLEQSKIWKTQGVEVCVSLMRHDDINILKLLQLQPKYISLPWPFARNAITHKAVTEIVAFMLNRGIEVLAYCPHGVGAPQQFSGAIQQKPYH